VKRILVIDDSEANREVFKWALGDFCQIDEMSSGVGAAEKIASTSYDLIFLDLMMPIVDGYQVIEDLVIENSKDLENIVVVTAVLNQEKVDDLQKTGVAAVVERPYLPDDITRLFKKYCRDSVSE